MADSAVLENVRDRGHFEQVPETHVRPLTKLDPEQPRQITSGAAKGSAVVGGWLAPVQAGQTP